MLALVWLAFFSANSLLAQTYTDLLDFNSGTGGGNPQGALLLSGNTLYGTTVNYGTGGQGTVFSVNTDGTGYTTLYNFTGGNDGATPYGQLVLSGGVLYGTTAGGGADSVGTVFAVNTNGSGFQTLYTFTDGSDGGNPQAGLVLAGKTLYGTAQYGGEYGNGAIFSVNTDGTGFTTLYSFMYSSDGAIPSAGLALSGATLFGTAEYGGDYGYGTVFSVDTNGDNFATLYSFTDGSDGGNPDAGLIVSGNMLYGTTPTAGASDAGIIFSIETNSGNFATVHSFTAGDDGGTPEGGVVLEGGTLYGTTEYDGAANFGTVFSVNTNGGGFTTLYDFADYSSGVYPSAGLTLAGLTVYGTAADGGADGIGTVFSIALPCPNISLSPATLPDGKETVNYYEPITASGGVAPITFALTAGSTLPGGVSLSPGGVLSGVVSSIGIYNFGISGTDANGCPATNYYTIQTGPSPLDELHGFSYPFDSTNSDGASPSGVVLAGNTLFGTAEVGGTSADGTIFAVNTDGTGFTTLHNFSATSTSNAYSGTNKDGSVPSAGVIASGNMLYGTAQYGGTGGDGTVFAVKSDGTGFTTLHSFTVEVNYTNTDGSYPVSKLILDGSTLYGTTPSGGLYGEGTVFSVKTDGSDFATLYDFTGGSDGAYPECGLILSGTTLYGTTEFGGNSYDGTVFAINTDGTGFTNVYSFSEEYWDPAIDASTNGDGANPTGELVRAGNTLYGVAQAGGAGSEGTVFAVNTDGTGFATLYNFSPLAANQYNQETNFDGAGPSSGLALSGNILYGTTQTGGIYSYGTTFSIHTDGTDFTSVYAFNFSDGAYPNSQPIISDNVLYGTAAYGGNTGYGEIFGIETCPSLFLTPGALTNGNIGDAYSQTFAVTGGDAPYNFAVTEGSMPAGVSLSPAGVMSGVPTNIAAYNFTVTATDATGCQASIAYTVGIFAHFTLVHGFTNGEDGGNPNGGLVLSGNTLYGTAGDGGSGRAGVVFAVNTDGTDFTPLHSFNGVNDGSGLQSSLLLSGNTLYGSTYLGGSGESGSLFSVNNYGGGFETVYNFTGGSDGYFVEGTPALAGGTLFATARGGGGSSDGTLVAVNIATKTSTETHTFAGPPNDGASPYGGVIVSGNVLYGTTDSGGTSHYGTVFAVNTNGSNYTILHNFSAPSYGPYPFPTNSDGTGPLAGLILAGNTLYGTAPGGGNFGNGTVFAVNTNGSNFRVLHHFSAGEIVQIGDEEYLTNSDGFDTYAGLVLSGNTLYGTASGGGSFGLGTAFSVKTDGTGFTTLYDFSGAADGSYPQSSLIIVGTTLYGTTVDGSVSNYGEAFALGLGGPNPAVPPVVTWPTPPPLTYGSPLGAAQLDATASVPGNFAYDPLPGTVFPNAGSYPISVIFTPADTVNYSCVTDTVNLAVSPAPLTVKANNAIRAQYAPNPVFSGTINGLVNGDNITAAYTTPAAYDSVPGAYPIVPGLVDPNARAGNYTVSFIDGTLTVTPLVDFFNVLHGFSITTSSPGENNDGFGPIGGLIVSNNVLYGTAAGGGTHGDGTVYSVHTDGSDFTTLYDFSATTGCCGIYHNNDGDSPECTLALAGPTLFGAAIYGGTGYAGTLFNVNTNGSNFETLHDFQNVFIDSQNFPVNGDGDSPYSGVVVTNGMAFGTAIYGGSLGQGVVFSVNTNGSGFTTLHNFTAATDGVGVFAGVALANNILYGTAQGGGANGGGTVFALLTNGTGFTVLHSFTPATDGVGPDGTLILAGNVLYGTAEAGGSYSNGTVFSIHTDGTHFTVLHVFSALSASTNSDGAQPLAGLTLSPDGTMLYGTAINGGAYGYGAVYAIGTNGADFTNLYSFTDGLDGAHPQSSVVVSGYSLFGTTSRGGVSGSGTIYSLTFLPQLSISLFSANIAENGVAITWPASDNGFSFVPFTLQSTINLSPTNWNDVSPLPTVVNGECAVVVPLAGTQAFFRLVQQLGQ